MNDQQPQPIGDLMGERHEPARHRRTETPILRQYTYYGREDHCAICDVDFDDVPADQAGQWTFHWNGAGVTLVAETCSDAHALEFEVFYRDEIAAEWAETVAIKQGRQKVVRKGFKED